jgi:hypothetical protein
MGERSCDRRRMRNHMAKKHSTEPAKAPTAAQVIKQIDKARKAQELDRLHRATDGTHGEALKKEDNPGEPPG